MTINAKTLVVSGLLLGAATALVAKDGETGRLPAMGWNNWNEYECDISEDVFLTVGKLLIDLGLKDLGYEYVNIDDCWSNKTHPRDDTGRLVADSVKFPLGIAHTASEIHALGLKLGIYSDAGDLTCAGYAGSLGHEDIDAATFAEWGIDYLKYDNCAVPSTHYDPYRWWPENWFGGPPRENQTLGGFFTNSKNVPAPQGYDWSSSVSFDRFNAMSRALAAQDRSIQYSQCIWGHAHVHSWGERTGQSWRMWGDIYPMWTGQYQWSWGLMPILNHAAFFTDSTGFSGHHDYDMLEVGNGNLTLEENRSHFAMWAALKSPLIIGTPLDGIKPEMLAVLSNRALIAFNQDSEVGESARPYKWGINPWGTWNQTHPAEYWSGKSSKGAHVFVLNSLDEAGPREVVFAEVPELKDGGSYRVTDMWTGEDKGVFETSYTIESLNSHDTAALTFVEEGSEPYFARAREL